MADEKKKITVLTQLTTPAVDDYIPIVDKSDTTQAASGTTKWIAPEDLDKIGATELTIASDAITITQKHHKLQPQTGTTDDLSTISGTANGQSGVLYCSDYGTDTITIKHNIGNILCVGATDITLSNGHVAWYSDGTKVFMSGGGGGGGTTTSVPRNILLNGGFPIWTRQVPGTLTARVNDTYFADRWNLLTNGDATDIQCARTAGDTNSQFAGQLKQTNATAKYMGMEQIILAQDSIPFRGRAVRFQFRAITSTNTNLRAAILEWTGTADIVTSNIVKDWTSGTYTANNFFLASNLTVTAVSGALAATTSYQDFSITGTIGASCNNLILVIWTQSTVAQNVTIDTTQAGFYDGISAQAWQPENFSSEITACKYYCQRIIDPGTGGKVNIVLGYRFSTNFLFYNGQFSVPMRVSPTCYNNVSALSNGAPTGTEIGVINNTIGGWTTIVGALTYADEEQTTTHFRITITAGTSLSGAAGNLCDLRYGVDVISYASAEL